MTDREQGKKLEQRKRQARRARWQSVFSWGTVVTAIAGFFGVWHSIDHGLSMASTTSNNAPAFNAQQSGNAQDPGSARQGRHHHGFATGDPSGSGGSGLFASGGSGQGSVGINPNPNQAPDFGSSGS